MKTETETGLDKVSTEELIEELELCQQQTEPEPTLQTVKYHLRASADTDNLYKIAEDEIMKALPAKTFKDTLHIREVDGKRFVYTLDDKISLSFQDNKVVPMIGYFPITGAKRLALFQFLISNAILVDSYESRADYAHLYDDKETVFSVYIIKWNDKLYDIGFIYEEERNQITLANNGANYMRKHSDYHHKVDKKEALRRRPLTELRDNLDWESQYAKQQSEIDYAQEQIELAIETLKYYDMLDDSNRIIGERERLIITNGVPHTYVV